MPTDPAAPMTARERAERAVMEIVIALKLSPKLSAQTIVERALTEHTAAVTAALEAAERTIADLIKPTGQALDMVYAPDGETWKSFAFGEAAKRGAAEERAEAAERRVAELEDHRRVAVETGLEWMDKANEAERRVGEAVAAEREVHKVCLTVLCAARDGQSWSAAMLKDFDIAIEGCRARATPAGQGEAP